MGQAKRKAASSPTSPADKDLDSYKKKFALSQDLCERARRNAETNQDYYDGIQWTDTEKEILKARKQPALVFNEIKAGINGMIGIVERGKTDPRAYGRGKNDSESAEVATDCLRYVADKNRFQNLRSQAMKDFFIQGICCAVVEIDDQREVIYRKGRYEAFFYDPYSREPDFEDARWKGLGNWTDEDDALTLPWVDSEEKRTFIKQSVDLSEPGMGGSNDTTEDRPKDGWSWGDKVKRRLMVVQMWYKKGAIWHMCVFVSAGVLHDGPSEYKDDRGRPTCNLVAQSAYVDRENKRYGAVDDMRGPQDAMNKGWSKAVHILNVSKLRVDPGVQNVDDLRKEWARPDGVVEARKDQVEEIGDKQLLPAHIEMLQLAEQKMRRQTPTPGIVGRNASSQSGKAILAEQQAGMTEQAPMLGSFDDWTLRIYRMTWACIKQYWDAPKYIRITDDETAPKYVLLNQPEIVTDPKTGQPVIDPATGQPKVRMVKPAEIDADIIIDSTPDTATLAEDQYKGLLELATVQAQTKSGPPIPFKAIIQASSLPKKRQVIEAMDEAEKAAKEQGPTPNPEMAAVEAKAQVSAKQMELEAMQAQHKSQLAEQQAQADAQLAAFKAQSEQALAEKQFQLDAWKAQQDVALKRETLMAQIGIDQELAAHQAAMAERKAQTELTLKARQQESEQQLAGERHQVETKQMLEKARAAKGEGPEPEKPKPTPKRVKGSITIGRDKAGKASGLTIEHVMDDGTVDRQQMVINRNAPQANGATVQ